MLSSMSSEMMEAMLSSVAEKLAARPDTAPEELSRPGTAEAAMLSSMSQEQVAALLSTVSEKLAARPATAAEEGSRPGTAEGNMLSFVASDLMASMMASVSEKLAARPVTVSECVCARRRKSERLRSRTGCTLCASASPNGNKVDSALWHPVMSVNPGTDALRRAHARPSNPQAATRPATARVDHAPEDEVVQSKEPEAAVAEPAATAAEEPVVPTAEEQAVAAVEEHPTLPARPAVPGPGAEYKDGAFEMVQTVLKSTLARMETGGSAASFGSIDAKVAVRDIIDVGGATDSARSTAERLPCRRPGCCLAPGVCLRGCRCSRHNAGAVAGLEVEQHVEVPPERRKPWRRCNRDRGSV